MTLPPIARWNVDADLCELHGGHRNLVFRTVGLAQELVFKATRRSQDAVEWLVHIHSLAEVSGFVVPSLQESKNKKLVDDGWTCETYVEGTPFDIADMPLIEGRISQFHVLAKTVPQRPGFLSSKDLVSTDAGGDIDLSSMPRPVAQKCRNAWRAAPHGCFSVVHADLNPNNLLHTADGQPALLDWDECRRDLTFFDLGHVRDIGPLEQKAIVAWEVACSWQLEPDHARDVARRL